MKIGFDAKRAYHSSRGLGTYSRSVLESFRKHYPSNQYHLYKPKGGNQVWNEGVGFVVHENGRLPGAYWRTFKIGKEMAKDSLDIYHGLSNELPVSLKSKKTKYVVTIHDLIWWKHPEFYSAIDRKIYRWKTVRALSTADHVVAVSNNTRQDLIEFFPEVEERLSVVHPICAEQFYERKCKADVKAVISRFKLPKNFILYVGALNKNKRIDSIINALSILKHSDIHLVVVGDGSERENLFSLSNKYGLSERVLWVNKKANPSQIELSVIYQIAKATVLLSHYEGFGLPIIESLASRTPVITLKNSSLPEAAGPGAVYVKSNDTDKLSAAIESLLLDSQLHKRLSSDGYEHALKFQPHFKAKELMNLYKSLVS